jgi:hypothetical protein
MQTNVNRQQSQTSPCEICGGQSGTRRGFSTTDSVFLTLYHFTSAVHPISSTSYSYQRDKWMKPGNFPNSCILLEIWEHWIEKNFHFSLQRFKEIAGEFLN